MGAGAAFFISYSRGDAASRKLAAALSYSLPRLGYQVFVDVVGLQAGEKWTEQLEEQIDACDVFVILVSEKSLASEHVSRELERALARNEATERPLIVPIRVQFTRELEGEEQVLDEFERLDWESKSDTPHVVERIDEAVSQVIPKPAAPEPPPRRTWRRGRRGPVMGIAAGVALLLAVVVGLAYVQARALAGAKSDEDARVAFERLRMLRVSPWNPERLAEAYFARRADAIDADAALRLGSRMRQEADQGLLLATLAAFKRGGALSNAARDYAKERNYALLVATLRSDEPSPGRALAVWRGPRRLLIAEGTRVWSCSAEDFTRCEQAELPGLDAVKDAAFVSETQLVTVSVDGSVNQWDLERFEHPVALAIREGDAGVSVDADGGDVAIVFDTAPRVVIVLADGRRISAPRDLPPVTRATFGRCGVCVMLLFDNERVVQWDYDSGTQAVLTDGADDVAATRKGAVATAMRDGTIRFLSRVRLRFESFGQLAISEDGHRAAVVHDDMLSVVDDGGDKPVPLIPAGLTPAPVAAAWAGDVLVTRTPSEVRLWQLDRPSVRDVAPGDAWRERRKQLGMTVDARENVVAGNGGPVQLGWNRARRRIEPQN
ncbi:MAG TPA: toll/interleukin-1 receptor domain-containing protein [Thermoanaerobaculia bacterium]|nr:toll/interleukin-1 receptor domain-containing protein [Thermoanaerobaculia bacterium]